MACAANNLLLYIVQCACLVHAWTCKQMYMYMYMYMYTHSLVVNNNIIIVADR